MRARTLTSETILRLGVNERNFPNFRVGDTVCVYQHVTEGEKERVQAFTGDVIASRNNGIASTFVVRKMSTNNVAVERIFPLYSPIIKEIKIVRHGKSRQAQAYYLRDRIGKSARFQEVIERKHKLQAAPAEHETTESKPE